MWILHDNFVRFPELLYTLHSHGYSFGLPYRLSASEGGFRAPWDCVGSEEFQSFV